MRFSEFFLPTLRETPSEAKIASHRLMLRAGMIHQIAAGIYAWLPLGVRVLKKVEAIIREEQNLAGAQEVILPTIQPLELWAQGGRPDAMGKETLRMKDRHEREMLYAPTAEEVVTDLFRKNVVSYRELPKLLYQIHWKFRDEIRPRFGVMRGREFLMKDCYSFDLDQESAQKSYQKMFACYLKTFARLNLNAIPVKADSGAIGGDLSHEFQILASTGESEIYYDVAWDDLKIGNDDFTPQTMMGLYAAADEMHDPKNCPVPLERLKTARGIEVGHVFYLGTKYSAAMNAGVADTSGNNVIVHMGCYGIGVSRLIGAVIEAHHDENGIVWPESIAPFKVGLINLRKGDKATEQVCAHLYETLLRNHIEVLYDDREERAGVKFSDMDLIGLPYQLLVGPRGASNQIVELKVRKTGQTQEMSTEAALKHIVG
jgi:prolyl-tRNA synthetase